MVRETYSYMKKVIPQCTVVDLEHSIATLPHILIKCCTESKFVRYYGPLTKMPMVLYMFNFEPCFSK